MESSNSNKKQIEEIDREIKTLQLKLEERKRELQLLITAEQTHIQEEKAEDLTNEDIMRYSRQMIVPAIGVQGQKSLKKSSVLIIGCGGLGCPAAQYLTGGGIGRLGLVDYDVVEQSNLHRQLLHSELTIGIPKVTSLAQALHRINSKLVIDEYNLQLDSHNAINMLSKYDVVIDASDNVATRYLVNDACVLTGRPLVSGSAVGLEAQLTVYNHEGGPCYRCLFSSPPPPETVSNCSDVGVVGPVPGTIGVLQALQAIHILTGNGKVLSQRLLLFDGEDMVFRSIKLRGKSETCAICGTNPSITKLIDYEHFCGAPANDKEKIINEIDELERISAKALHSKIAANDAFLLVDVRTPIEFEMCSIAGSLNIPLKELSKEETQNELLKKWRHIADNKEPDRAQGIVGVDATPPNPNYLNKNGEASPPYQFLSITGRQPNSTHNRRLCMGIQKPPNAIVLMICRRGNDSQLGVKVAKKFLPCPVYDIVGGLHAWSRDVDPTFPKY